MTTELWTPKHDLKNKVSLYQADELTGYSDTDPITSCPDVTEEGNDLAAGSSVAPLYQTNVINGLPVIEYPVSGNKRLTTTSHRAYSADDWTFFFLVNLLSVGDATNHYLWDTQTGRLICIANHNADDNYRFHDGDNDIFGAAVSGWQILVFLADSSGGTKLYKNGTQVGSSGTYTQRAISANVGLGSDYGGGGSFLEAELFAAGVVKGLVSTADRERIEGWGLHLIGLEASLPGGHTYASDPPLIQAVRSELGWATGELHRAGKLNAHNLALGRTRLLAESLPGLQYTAASTPISVHQQRVRGGKVIFSCAYVKPSSGTDEVTFRVIKDSDSSVLESVAVSLLSTDTTTLITQALDCPTNLEVRLEVEVTDDSGGLTVSDIQISEAGGAPSYTGLMPVLLSPEAPGAFVGVSEADFAPAPAEQIWLNSEEADSPDYNAGIVTALPVTQLVGRQKNGDEQSSAGVTPVDVFTVEADKLLGDYIFATMMAKAGSGDQLDARVVLYDGVTAITVASFSSTLSTTYVKLNNGGAVPTSAIGKRLLLAVQVADTGVAPGSVKGIKIYSGTKSAVSGYLY